MQGGRGLVIYRPRRWVQVMPAMDASPGLALLLRSVATVNPLSLAVRAVRGLAVWGVAVAPQPLKASFIVRELAYELHERILRVRRWGVDRGFAFSWCHAPIVLQCSYTVEG